MSISLRIYTAINTRLVKGMYYLKRYYLWALADIYVRQYLRVFA